MRISDPKWRLLVLAWTVIPVAAMLAVQVPARGEVPFEQLTMVGASTYRIYCANCHGKEAKGDGQVAPYLKQVPTDLTRLTKSHGGTFPAEGVFRAIDGREEVKLHGSREMPIWGDALSRPGPNPEAAVKQRIDGLVAFIQSLQQT